MKAKYTISFILALAIVLPSLWWLKVRLRDVALARAITTNNVTEVKRLLNAGADPNTQATFLPTTTALHVASQIGNQETVQLLLDKGANVNAMNSGGRTPIWYAVLYGHIDVVYLLIARRANVLYKAPMATSYEPPPLETPRAMITRKSQHTSEAVKTYKRQRRPVFSQIIKLLEEAEKKQRQQPHQ